MFGLRQLQLDGSLLLLSKLVYVSKIKWIKLNIFSKELEDYYTGLFKFLLVISEGNCIENVKQCYMLRV